jgi:hypothetical protein
MGAPVHVVTVSCKTAGLAVDCLRSIAGQCGPSVPVRAAVGDVVLEDGLFDRRRGSPGSSLRTSGAPVPTLARVWPSRGTSQDLLPLDPVVTPSRKQIEHGPGRKG